MTVPSVRLRYRNSSPFNGAFTYLQKYFNKDEISEDIVKITSKSSGDNLVFPVEKRDLGFDYFGSCCESDNWYEVDFLQNNFFLESYEIRDYYWDFFPSWEVLGTNDGVHYDVVDNVTGFEQPSVGHHNLHFKCKYPKTRRSFRIIVHGNRFQGDTFFYIYRLEFYGRFNDLCLRNSQRCLQRNNNNFILCIMIALINK